MEKMVFKAHYLNPETMLVAESDNAKALFSFAKRTSVAPHELHLISKIGFEVIISGQTREFGSVLKRENIIFERTQEGLIIGGSRNENSI